MWICVSPGEFVRRRKVSAILVAAAIGFALAEVVARTCTAAVMPQQIGAGEIIAESGVAGRGWELVPGASLSCSFPDRRGATRELALTVPAHGWRGEPFEALPRSDVVRIACVGDSQTFGWGVADDETLPYELERALTARSPACEFEVLNLGVPNTNVEHKVAWIESFALDNGAAIVVLELFFDDLWLDGIELAPNQEDRRRLARLRPGSSGTLDFLREHSRIVDLVIEHTRQRIGAEAYASMYQRLLRPAHPVRARTQAALERVAASARARAVELICIVYPLPVQVDQHWASAGIDAELCTMARAAGIATLELGPALEGCIGPACIHPLDHHASASAHRAASVATADFLLATGAIERAQRFQSHAGVEPPASQR